MKKIACLSAVAACVLAVTAGTAFAGQSTVTGGYAQGDFQGVANKADGFNLKYRYEFDNNPLGVIGSFTHVEKDRAENGTYNKAQYNSITAGPAYRFNDWASIYGVIGVGYGKNVANAQDGSHRGGSSDYGFTYGAGLQFNPIQEVALDVGYEQSRIRNTDIGIWSVGVGYRF
ncbi:outer membrane protein OmpX [Serratia rhizosphaerae]|uniref:Outer membrane protein X n=1 Tax=Serratia rhizosphaerae TaxID=2597702 RepID=A0ABX6GID3_9GAMM|nr:MULTISPECIES: outer membrane protein OmpX [Serratia]MBU3891652.1 outer membrane protein OmpX [Serratia rubidaea]AVJ16875.1 outer membrane protein OmpX [Serratia sp. MYb239]MCA4823651.1 outer membrane protein OmpX [Serratia rubidaea]MEB6335241.1 outer membrane protein OmpX [Serratia rhizosphaerae]QHA86021.1 outer membrane protein OmpX [Serratia rhizosphaerae]